MLSPKKLPNEIINLIFRCTPKTEILRMSVISKNIKNVISKSVINIIYATALDDILDKFIKLFIHMTRNGISFRDLQDIFKTFQLYFDRHLNKTKIYNHLLLYNESINEDEICDFIKIHYLNINTFEIKLSHGLKNCVVKNTIVQQN